jgi:hypothetical protein
MDPHPLVLRQSRAAAASTQPACFLLSPSNPLPSSLDPLLSSRVAPPFSPRRPPFSSCSPSLAGLPSPAWRSHGGSRGAAMARIELLLPCRHLLFSLSLATRSHDGAMGTAAALEGLHGARGTTARGTTDAGPSWRAELLVRGSCRRGVAVAARHGTGKQWRRSGGEGGGCGSGGPIRRREVAASTRVDSSTSEHMGGFRRQAHERRRRRCSPSPAARPKSAREAAAAARGTAAAASAGER